MVLKPTQAGLRRAAQLLRGGAARGGTASTVVDLTGPEPHVLREGAIPTPELLGPPQPRSG